MVKDKIKSLVETKMKGNSKKTIENLIVFLILLIITIIAINLIWGGKKDNSGDEVQEGYKVLAQDVSNSNILESKEYNLENELEDILSKISGAGKVQVLVTYSETSQVVAMHNETNSSSKTEETDSNRRNKKYRDNRYRYRINIRFWK